MQSNLFKKLSLSIFLLSLNACMYTNVGLPFDTDLDRTQLGSKIGEASMQSLFWTVAWGDSSTHAAAKNGGITTIHHADRKRFLIFFGLYAKETLVVYGD